MSGIKVTNDALAVGYAIGVLEVLLVWKRNDQEQAALIRAIEGLKSVYELQEEACEAPSRKDEP